MRMCQLGFRRSNVSNVPKRTQEESVRRIKRDRANSGRGASGRSHQGEREPVSDAGLSARPEAYSNSGRVKQPEEATDAGASNIRPEAQIIRFVPKIRAHSPWEVYFGALREYQNQWLRLWASFLPR
jgi:hypothetical protein